MQKQLFLPCSSAFTFRAFRRDDASVTYQATCNRTISEARSYARVCMLVLCTWK